MSEIKKILDKLNGTCEYDILCSMEKAYEKIALEQNKWYSETNYTCPDGCGSCCIDYEPDLLDCEALYMAAWLIENQYEIAIEITNQKFPFENQKTCPFFNSNAKYHCSIYGGRPSICRLFGGSCFYDSENIKVWRPCKFFNDKDLKLIDNRLEHKDYNPNEFKMIFKNFPPAMSDMMEDIIAISPDSNSSTNYIRHILPKTISRLLWIINLNENKASDKED